MSFPLTGNSRPRPPFAAPRLRVMSLLSIFVLALALPAAAKDKPTVAIFDFEIGPSVQTDITTGVSRRRYKETQKTNLLTNKLVTTLTRSNEITVVEREKIANIMQEAQLSESDLTDPDKATKIGRLLGASYMLFGSISTLEGSVQTKKLPYNAGTQEIMTMTCGADVRLVNTETGQIEAAASLSATKTDKKIGTSGSKRVPASFQQEVYAKLVDKITQRIVTTLNPIKVATLSGGVAYLNRGNIERGTRFIVVKLGQVIHDPDNPDKVLGQTEQKIAQITVNAGMDQMSKASIDKWLVDDKKIPAGSICRPIFDDAKNQN